MPHCLLKQSVGNGSGNRLNKHVRSGCMFLFILCLLLSAAQDLSEVSDALPSICPQGPENLKCTCTHLEVNCTDVGLFTVSISLGTRVQSVILRKNFISSIDSITSQLPSLVYIDASHNTITSVDWLSLSTLTNLEELYLQMNLIYSLDLSYFHGTKLRVLNISGNKLAHILDGGLNLPLEELYIENCGFNYFDFGASNSLCKLKILHIGGNSFSYLPVNALNCMTNLEEIDLSNNHLTTLPATIFDGLDKLRVLNLAGNSWTCDCNLFWLKVFIESVLATGGTIVNKNLTYCTVETSLSNSITELATYPFSGCEDGQLYKRAKRAFVAGISPLNWTTKCTIWQSSLLIPICGPSKAASCVFDFPNNSYSLVQFSGEISGIMSKTACRDICQENNNSYFIYDSSSISCLCGDVVSNAGCTECSSSTITTPSLCNGRYSNVGGALSVMYDLTITFSPSLPQVMSKVNFTLNGGASFYDTILWNFGDATTRSVLNDKSAFHTYIYPGQFEVIVILSSSTSQNILPTQMVIQLTVVSTSDTGELACPSSVVKASDILNVSAVFTFSWNQKVKWTRIHQNHNGQADSTEFQKECELLWTQFRGRCIQVFTTASIMATAYVTCTTKEASLLRFYSYEEIAELKSSSLIFQSGVGARYYTGAEWNSTMERYMWKNTTINAHVFRETLPDSAQGNCVALTKAGLQGVACNEQLSFVCEKDPVTCTGSQQYDGQTCYVVVNQPATWDKAHFACQSTYKNGMLTSIFDSSHNLFVSGLLTSQTWIGLRAWTAPGHYTWQDGQIISGYMNWVKRAGIEPCVSINSSGIWKSEVCDSLNSYVCEYFVGDEVTIPWQVAGFVPVINDAVSPMAAMVAAPPQLVTSSPVTLLLGSWFSSSGHLLRWNMQVQSGAMDTKLALQIWRPFCMIGFLAWPGCNNNRNPLFTCINTQVLCSTSGTCLDGKYLCVLTNTCLPIAKPCTCASVSSNSSLRCQNLIIDSKTSKLQLVYMITIKVPARTTQLVFEPEAEVVVQAGDVIGFQSESKDTVVCEEQSESEWRHPLLSASTDYWMDVGDSVDPQTYQLKQDVVCRINAVYTSKKSMSSPVALNYVTAAGVYNFTVATNSSSQTCSVTVMDDVRGLLWVYPEARMQVTSSQGPKVLNVNVEAGQPHALTVKVLQGSNPSVSWFLNGGSGISTVFSSRCPASITYPPDICQIHSSLLEYPYSSLSRTFPRGSSITNVTVNVTNDISWEALHVNIYAYAPVTEVEFYHNDCVNHTACEVTVEAGKTQEFHVKVVAGDMSLAVFYENGQVINPSPSDLSVLPRIFQKSGIYVLSVNVSNPLSWIITNLTVYAQIKANFHNLSFDRVSDKVSAGTVEAISATVELAVGAYIVVIWSFNEESSHELYMQVNTSVQNLNYTYRFNMAKNVTVTLLLSDMFGNNLSISKVIEVYRNIEFPLVLNTSSRYVATLQDFSLIISVDNCSHADTNSYGLLVFSVLWDDDIQGVTWRNSSPLQEVQHQYKIPGFFTVSVTVMSLYNSSNIQRETIVIEAQDVITGLNLTYDGPKHFSENITFTAAQKFGTNVEYSIDFGDNITVTSFQTSPVFIYKYLVADVYWAIVVAKNAVSERTYRLTLYAYDENLLRIIRINAKYYVAVGKTVDISAEVAAESPSQLLYDWNFGNSYLSSGHPMITTTTSYAFIGIYTISLKVQKNVSSSLSDIHRKEICVEEEVSGLSVLYDETPAVLQQPGALVHILFQASVVKGSNLTYTWKLGSGRGITQQNTLNLTITEAGVYTVMVKVENNLNYQVETVELTAIEIITRLQIHCRSCSSLVYARTHVNTTLEASLLYGTLVNYTWNFNDSSPSKSGQMVQHIFLTPRAYLVTILAENSVSNESGIVSIIAQDEVTGVKIKTSPSTVEVNANVTFQATLISGSSVNISWNCDSNVIGNNSMSLIHAFTSAGYHQCSILISNAVSSVTETSRLAVLDQIKDLSINQSLKAKPGTVTLYASVGLEYTFTPHINTDFLVDYEWSIMSSMPSPTVVGKSVFKYTFKSIGTYQTILKANNSVSSKSASITVEAQEQISKVYIDSNKTSPVQVFVGEAVLFRAVVGTGSQLSYLWILSGVAQPSKNDSVILSFQTPGNFTVQFVVTNDLDTVTAIMQVSVYIRVSNVTIQTKPSLNLPFVSQGTSLDLYSTTISGTALVHSWTIIHVPTKRQFTSNLINISFSFNLTGMYQVIVKVMNALSFEEDQLTLVVQGVIKELKVTLQNSLVATNSSLAFTCEVNLDASDVTYLWHVDGEIKRMSSFIKLFSKAGEYKVLIIAANNVSSMMKESLVRVLDTISNLQILDCKMVRKTQVLTSIQATVDSGTNITFTWYIEISKQNKTFTGQTVSINFTSEGSYNVILIAHNDISTSTTNCQLQSQLSISDVTLVVSDPSPDYIFQNQNVTFTANGRNFANATFEWRLANSTLVSKSSTYITSLATAGNYTLTLTISNEVSQVKVYLEFTVKEFSCQLPDVSRVGASTRSFLRSRPLELEVAIDAKNCADYIAVHRWTVINNSICTGDEDAGQKVDIGDTIITSPSLVIGARKLDVGSYCIHFVTGYQYTSVSLSISYSVNVTASKLKAIIKGGDRRVVAIGSDIRFDGTLSFDPDETNESSLIYKWTCLKINATNAKGGCFSDNSSNIFYYQGFISGEYLVTLEVYTAGRQAETVDQLIEVLNTSDFLPIASIVCVSCLTLGNSRISASQHVVLSAACENCHCQPSFEWTIFNGHTDVFPNTSQTSTGLSREHLILNKWGILKDSLNYTFTVKVLCDSTSMTGTASLKLMANLPPTDGSCSFYPSEIIPLENVTVSCSGWADKDDPETLISFRIYMNTVDPLTGQNRAHLLYSGTDETQSVYLSSFAGKSVILSVMVGDEFGAFAYGGQSVITFKNVTLPGNMTKTDYLMGQADTNFSTLVKQSSPISLLQYAIALGQQLNMESQMDKISQIAGTGTKPEQTRAAVRDAVTICLSTAVPITTLEDVQQMAFALRLLTDYSSEYLTEDSQRLLANTLQVLNSFLQKKVINGLDHDDVPLDDLLSVIRNLLSAVNARIYSVTSVWESGRIISIDNFTTNFRDLRPEIAKIVDGMEFTDINLNETHRKFVVSTTVPLLEHILVSTLQTMIVDENGLELDIGGIKIKASRSFAKDIELQYVFDTAQISLPSTVLSGRKDILDEVFQIMISHERNPYTYGYRITHWARVPVQTISFYDTDGSYIQVADLADNARVGLCMFSSVVNTSTCMGKEMVNESDVNAVVNLNYNNVTIAPLKSKVWKVPIANSEAGTGVGVHVQLRFSILSVNSSNSTITGVTAYLGINFIPSSDHYSHILTLTPNLMDKGVDHRKYTFFQNNLNPSDKLHIVATNNNNHHEVELSVGLYFSNCEYFNTTSQIWANNGCQAQEESTAVITSCQCNHLTSFGGAGIVSITKIDFEDLGNLDILTNPVVFIAVAIIFVIYILVAILCHYLDHLDLKRISKIPLCGQVGSFLYEITVITGYHYNAGTSAQVGIKLYGTSSKGGARHITKPGAFQRNCHDTFIVANSTDLGEITKIVVWHDNTGLSPSWFLSHILVKDLQTESVYTFLINSWLSLEMDNGIIQKTVQASDEKELKEFYSQFSNIFHGLMADLHTWISVSNKPDHSRFTRVQRCTCCVTCLYLYMAINAMWFGFFKDQREVDLPLTWSFFGWEEIVIALASTLMVVPFLFGLALIFKKSRCKASMFQQALRPHSALTLEIDAACTISGDGGSYRTATPLGDWILALDRESTADSINQVPIGLKRTVPMHRDRRKGSNDSNASGKERLPVSNISSRKNFWNKDSIMRIWPDAVPHLLNKAKVQMDHDGTIQNKGSSAVSKRIIRPVRRIHSSKSVENSDDELQQQLDEAEAVIAKDEEKKKKRLAQKLRQANGDGLFDSDDEWVNEDLDVVNEGKSMLFNSPKEAELLPNLGRRVSRTSFTLPSTIPRKPESAGGSKRGSSSLQEGARPSIVSSSSKSKSILSGRLRSLSVVSQMSTQKNSGFMLPSWCVYIAYTVCIMLCLLSVILVLLYGYNFGRNVAIKWVVSLCFTLFISILVVEPLKVLVLSVYMTMRTGDIGKIYSDMIDIKPKIEFNEQIKDIKFRPLGGFSLLQAKEEGKKKQRLHVMMREVLVFSFMFALFLAIVYIKYSSNMYLSTSNIHNKLYAGWHNSTGSSQSPNITNLKSIPEFWQWTQTVLVRSLHYRQLYQMENFGYLMGPAWIRQIRGKIVTCPAALETNLLPVPELVTRRCMDSGTDDPDMASYATGWKTGSTNWTYVSGSQLNSFAKFGQSLMYLGGGYIQRLGQTYHETVAILKQLEAEGWVDLLTRVVFVEFTLYNPSKDLTSCVTLVLEFPTSGGILSSSYIWTEHLLRFIPDHVDPLMVCQIMFFPFVLYLTVMVSKALKSQKLLFFTHFWNWFDIFICIFVWANCGLYITCVVMATSEVKTYLADLTVPAQLEKVVLLHSVLRDVHACLVLLFSLKIVRQVRFFQPLYKLYTTLSTASTPLLGVFFMFAILLLTYAQFGYLLYGSAVYGYHSFQYSITSLFGLMGSHTNFWPMFESRRILTHLFFISFGIFVYGLVIALSVAVLTWSFKWSRAQMTYKTSLEARDYEMIEFMIKRFKLITGMQKQKPLFRHVKFEGLPSLPSRGTSSNISSRARSSPVLKISESGHTDTTEEYLHHCMASLKPAWDQVLRTVQKIEDLERQNEEKLQNLLRQMMKSSSKDSKLKMPNSRPIIGKPPLDLKSTFPRFKLPVVGKDIALHSNQLNVTQPSTSIFDSPLDTFGKSLPSSRKKRHGFKQLSNDLQPKKRLFYSSDKISPSKPVNSTAVAKGKVAPRFQNSSSSNSRMAGSKCSEGVSASKHRINDLEGRTGKQRQVGKYNSQDSEV